MALKTPLPDEVFQQWLKSKSSKEIEKVFGRKAGDISPMEVVGKEIQKSPALMFKTSVKGEESKPKEDKELYPYQQLEKEKFYKFDKKISKDDWDEKDTTVHMYKDIKEEKCDNCKGSGLDQCKHCKGSGVMVCEKCKDERKLNCRNCDGTGVIKIELELYNENGRIDKIEKKINCPDCHGRAKLICTECAGTKKVVCKKCKGEGGRSCKKCQGTGLLYRLPMDVVPFLAGDEVYFFWNSDMEKAMSKSKTLKGRELSDLLAKRNVEPIRVKNLKDLDKKKLEDQLGFWDKDASRQTKECKKTFEKKKKKSKSENPKFPIEIYPLQKIDIDTYKNKRFEIYSIGSQNGFIVFDLGF